ncbi:copper amine oxidase N-terminal domain-containing protein [Paenibacillus sp. SC116]|uniref:copper amine oxidase N-terminal domain-containing protein n=1 Tax=Paenibacillus sp. SC116 TaxID=2968986 RepID=UPI00215A2293|nr:copper amine oxidase N-terminal domain-containing protein [Paenibacillus sp. SC116]MCR8846566.1 copper amine oxidase N-terminal domain-containing protein [Paenibacillus sp. SC116]
MFNVSMKKTVIASTLALAIATGSLTASAAPSIVINYGQSTTSEVNPIVKNGVSLVEARPLLQQLGYKLKWSASNKSLTASKGTQTVVFQTNTAKVKRYKENTETNHQMLAPATLVKGQLYVPLRSVSDILGLELQLDSKKHTYTLHDPQAAALEERRLEETKDFFTKLAAHENSGDRTAYLDMFDKQSHFYKLMEKNPNQYSHKLIKTSYEDILVADMNENGVSVSSTVVSSVYNGEQAVASMTMPSSFLLKLGKSDESLESIVSMTPNLVSYQLKDGWEKTKATLPEADQKAFKELTNTVIESINTEDWEKLNSMFTADNYLVKMMLSSKFKTLFAQVDMKAELKQQVVLAADDKHAFFATVEKYTILNQTETPPMESTMLYSLERGEDGKWKISSVDEISSTVIGGEL